MPQADGRGLLKTSDDHVVECTRRDQNLDVRGHTPLFTDSGGLGHVENFMQSADMVESGCQILRRLVVDFECDDGQLPTSNRARNCRALKRRRFIERQCPQTIAETRQASSAESDAAARYPENARVRHGAGVNKVSSEGGACWCNALTWNAVVDDWQALQQQRGGWRGYG